MAKNLGVHRLIRGWAAASLCTWTAFAAHAHVAPTRASLAIMALITCVSAVIAMTLLGKKCTWWATSVVVLASQGLYHLSMSVMTHQSGGTLKANTGLDGHIHGFNVTADLGAHYATAQTDSMLYAHVLAAVTSIVVLLGGEKLLGALLSLLTLRGVRRLLVIARELIPSWPQAPGIFAAPELGKSAVFLRLPLRRGPPSPVLSTFA